MTAFEIFAYSASAAAILVSTGLLVHTLRISIKMDRRNPDLAEDTVENAPYHRLEEVMDSPTKR